MIDRRNAVLLGNLGPIPLFVHWTFLILVFNVWRWSMPDGRFRVDAFLIMLIVLVSGILLHELGHGLAARAQGALGVTITLWAFGGLCSSTRDRLPRRELVILIAGPAVSFLLAWGAWLARGWIEQAHPGWIYEPAGGGFVRLSLLGSFLVQAFSTNLILGVFNSMPIYPLDGGQIVFHAMRLFARDAIAAKVSLAIAVLGAGAVFAWSYHQRGEVDLWLSGLLAFLLMNAFASLR